MVNLDLPAASGRWRLKYNPTSPSLETASLTVMAALGGGTGSVQLARHDCLALIQALQMVVADMDRPA